MMRGMGKPGWLLQALRDSWCSRRYLISAYTTKRIMLEGWKLLR